jgi:hypothetical protein
MNDDGVEVGIGLTESRFDFFSDDVNLTEGGMGVKDGVQHEV